MFKRRAAGQRILPSEPAAPSMAPAPALSADRDYPSCGDEERAYDNGRQSPPIQAPSLPGFSAVGYMFRRLSLRR
jgi:hypothetical protein